VETQSISSNVNSGSKTRAHGVQMVGRLSGLFVAEWGDRFD